MSTIDFSADAENTIEASEDSLQRVIKLSELMVSQAKEVERLQQETKDAAAALFKTETETLPELMTELGMSLVKLKDGSTVEVIKDVHCAITEEKRSEAHEWLIANGFGGLIKTQVIAEFGRGERDKAIKYAQAATKKFPDHPAGMKDTVHPATLKSFVKEQLEKAANIPMETFGIRPFNRAKYKAAR